MLRYVMECGPVFWPMLLATGIMVAVIAVVVVQLVRGRATDGLHGTINAILALGGVVAVLGFLGQWVGMQKIAAVVAANRVINPHAVAVGLREAMHTAILGLLVLFIATTVWLILDTILRRAARRAA
jgi:hypothetical protein